MKDITSFRYLKSGSNQRCPKEDDTEFGAEVLPARPQAAQPWKPCPKRTFQLSAHPEARTSTKPGGGWRSVGEISIITHT